jgi:transcriptional regulator with XRE-family HTH domain
MKKISNESIELGKRLRMFRLNKGYSVEEVATKLGIAPSTYREWEKGRAITGNPYLKLSAVLEVGVYQILGVEDEARDQLFNCLSELEKIIQIMKRHV